MGACLISQHLVLTGPPTRKDPNLLIWAVINWHKHWLRWINLKRFGPFSGSTGILIGVWAFPPNSWAACHASIGRRACPGPERDRPFYWKWLLLLNGNLSAFQLRWWEYLIRWTLFWKRSWYPGKPGPTGGRLGLFPPEEQSTKSHPSCFSWSGNHWIQCHQHQSQSERILMLRFSEGRRRTASKISRGYRIGFPRASYSSRWFASGERNHWQIAVGSMVSMTS